MEQLLCSKTKDQSITAACFDIFVHFVAADNIMLYWLPGTATSSARLYWESFAKVR
jgi:hypothetical protein